MPPLRIARYLLFISLVLGLISVAKEVTPVYTLLTLGSLVTSLWMEEKGFTFPPNYLVTGAAAILILFNLHGIHWQVFFNRVMGILFILISAKLLSTKKVRDYLQLYLLSLLLMAGAAVVRWGMEFGFLLAANIFLLLTGLIFLFASTERKTISSKETQTLFLWGGIMSLALLPSTLLFFLILPRPSFTLTPGWSGGKTARSGFGEKISPGSVEMIKGDPSVAMRVEWLKGSRPPQDKLYWRGKVYIEYRHGVWAVPRLREKPLHLALPRGKDVVYRIFLEPHQSNALFALGIPRAVALKGSKAAIGLGYTLHAPSPITQRVSYTTRSRLVEAYPPIIPPNQFLRVPSGAKGPLQHLAQSIASKEKDPLALARAVERYLKTNHEYSFHPGSKGPYPVVSFLLNKGKGHCEYFATSMVLLLRIRGVPARIVAGFHGGEWNQLGNYYIVRNSDAHTWVEVYKKGSGWVPFDPTPPLPPEVLSTTKRLGAVGRFLDYLRFQWYHWVVSYSIERQTQLLKKTLALFSPSPQKPHMPSSTPPKTTIVLILTAGVCILFLYRFATWWRKKPHTWGEKLVKILQDQGFPIEPSETLLEIAQKVDQKNPALGEKIKKAVELYYWKEYGGGDVSSQTLDTMLQEIRVLLKKASKK